MRIGGSTTLRRVFYTVIAGGLLAGGVLLAYAQTGDGGKKSARAAQPVVKIHKGEKCVEPTEEMRRNHMDMVLHQRDRTVHQGVRTTKHSLKNCIDCHADPKTNSVLGKEGFCESCHAFAAVKMDCFECHSPSPQKSAGAADPKASRHAALTAQMRQATGAAANPLGAAREAAR